MGHYTQLLLAALTAAVLVAIGGAAVAGPLEDAAAAAREAHRCAQSVWRRQTRLQNARAGLL
jgi:hypothetical protein